METFACSLDQTGYGTTSHINIARRNRRGCWAGPGKLDIAHGVWAGLSIHSIARPSLMPSKRCLLFACTVSSPRQACYILDTRCRVGGSKRF